MQNYVQGQDKRDDILHKYTDGDRASQKNNLQTMQDKVTPSKSEGRKVTYTQQLMQKKR